MWFVISIQLMIKNISNIFAYFESFNNKFLNNFEIFSLKKFIFSRLKVDFFLFQSYFLLGGDGHTMDFSPWPDIRANITTLRLLNPSNADVYEYETQPYFLRSRYSKPVYNPITMTVNDYIKWCFTKTFTFNQNVFQTEAALLQDAVTVFSKVFTDNETFVDQFNMNPTTCDDISRPADRYNPDENEDYRPSFGPSSGRDVLNKIDEVNLNESICKWKLSTFSHLQNTVRGLTEDIRFDADGLRDLFYIEVLEIERNKDTGDAYRKVALYDTNNGITLLRNFSNIEEQTTISMQAKVFKVILREGPPFLQKK